MTRISSARFGLGQIVRHQDAAFDGVVIDVDAAFAGPSGQTGPIPVDQPYYQVLVSSPDGAFIAYAPESSLTLVEGAAVLTAREERRWFTLDDHGHHAPREQAIH